MTGRPAAASVLEQAGLSDALADLYEAGDMLAESPPRQAVAATY